MITNFSTGITANEKFARLRANKKTMKAQMPKHEGTLKTRPVVVEKIVEPEVTAHVTAEEPEVMAPVQIEETGTMSPAGVVVKESSEAPAAVVEDTAIEEKTAKRGRRKKTSD